MSIINSTSTKITANKAELKKALAKMLTNLINNKKWSDKDAAKELDVNQSIVSNLSKGVVNNITMDSLFNLFVKFGYKSELKTTSNKDISDIIITKVPIKET
jgi:predicted XRE-type DNA-binding protein